MRLQTPIEWWQLLAQFSTPLRALYLIPIRISCGKSGCWSKQSSQINRLKSSNESAAADFRQFCRLKTRLICDDFWLPFIWNCFIYHNRFLYKNSSYFISFAFWSAKFDFFLFPFQCIQFYCDFWAIRFCTLLSFCFNSIHFFYAIKIICFDSTEPKNLIVSFVSYKQM